MAFEWFKKWRGRAEEGEDAKKSEAGASRVNALAGIPDLFSPEGLADGLRGATLDRIEILLAAMEAADGELSSKMETLLRSICPKASERLGEIEDLIARTLESIEEFQRISGDAQSSPTIIDSCEKEIALAQARLERLRSLAVVIGFKVIFLLKINTALQQLQAQKTATVKMARATIQPQVDLLAAKVEARGLEREVQAVADFAIGEMDAEIASVSPEIVELVETAVGTHRDVVDTAKALLRIDGAKVVHDHEAEAVLDVQKLGGRVQKAISLLEATPLELLHGKHDIRQDDLDTAVKALRKDMAPYLGEVVVEKKLIPVRFGDDEAASLIMLPADDRVFDQHIIMPDLTISAAKQYGGIKGAGKEAERKRAALIRQREDFEVGDLGDIAYCMKNDLNTASALVLEAILDHKHYSSDVAGSIFNIAAKSHKDPDFVKLAKACLKKSDGASKDPEGNESWGIFIKTEHYPELAAMSARRSRIADTLAEGVNDELQREHGLSEQYLRFVIAYLTFSNPGKEVKPVDKSILKIVGDTFRDLGLGAHPISAGLAPGSIYNLMHDRGRDCATVSEDYLDEFTSDPDSREEDKIYYLLHQAMVAYVNCPEVGIAEALWALNWQIGTEDVPGKSPVSMVIPYLCRVFETKPMSRFMQEFLRLDVKKDHSCAAKLVPIYDALARNSSLASEELWTVGFKCNDEGIVHIIENHPNTNAFVLDRLEARYAGKFTGIIEARRKQLAGG